MDGAVVYKMKPLFDTISEVGTSSSMYKIKNLLKTPINKSDVVILEKPDTVVEDEEKVLARQEKLLSDLKQLQDRISTFRSRVDNLIIPKTVVKNLNVLDLFTKAGVQDFVICVDPQYPSYSLLWLPKLWNLPINVSVHVHSSVDSLPEFLNIFKLLETKIPNPTYIDMTFIWKQVGLDTQLIVSPMKGKTILGEVNLLRFFDYILNNDRSIDRTSVDEVLDIAHRLIHSTIGDMSSVFARLQKLLTNDKWFLQCQNPTIADAAMWSALKKLKTKNNVLPPTLGKWMSRCSELLGNIEIY